MPRTPKSKHSKLTKRRNKDRIFASKKKPKLLVMRTAKVLSCSSKQQIMKPKQNTYPVMIIVAGERTAIGMISMIADRMHTPSDTPRLIIRRYTTAGGGSAGV